MAEPLIRLEGIKKVFYTDEVETHALSGHPPRDPARASTSPSRARRAAARRRCSRSSVCSTRRPRAATRSTGEPVAQLTPSRARAHPEPADRIHLPGVQPDRRSHGLRERRAPAHLPRHAGGRAQEARAGCARARRDVAPHEALSRRSSPAVSSSAWPWPAPWPAIRVILLADEPTGNLDSTNGEAVMELLRELHRGGATICMVTHDPRYARHAERSIHLFDGKVVEERQLSAVS